MNALKVMLASFDALIDKSGADMFVCQNGADGFNIVMHVTKEPFPDLTAILQEGHLAKVEDLVLMGHLNYCLEESKSGTQIEAIYYITRMVGVTADQRVVSFRTNGNKELYDLSESYKDIDLGVRVDNPGINEHDAGVLVVSTMMVQGKDYLKPIKTPVQGTPGYGKPLEDYDDAMKKLEQRMKAAFDCEMFVFNPNSNARVTNICRWLKNHEKDFPTWIVNAHRVLFSKFSLLEGCLAALDEISGEMEDNYYPSSQLVTSCMVGLTNASGMLRDIEAEFNFINAWRRANHHHEI